jgi:hypothetical protein
MDWQELVTAEPRLGQLMKDVMAADSNPRCSFCGVTAWHGRNGRPGFKTRLMALAGFYARNPELRSAMAFEVATQELMAVMPACRGCLCVAEEELV